jgi:hypothetical protein
MLNLSSKKMSASTKGATKMASGNKLLKLGDCHEKTQKLWKSLKIVVFHKNLFFHNSG